MVPWSKRRPVVDRVAEKVALTDTGCMVWIGATNNRGYGTIGTGGKSVGVHRWSYEHHVGPIPDGLEVDHLCKTRTCINPDHLEVVTHAENLMRGTSFSATHARKTHCIRGHEFTPENTRRTKHGRECRACCRIRDRKRRPRKTATVNLPQTERLDLEVVI